MEAFYRVIGLGLTYASILKFYFNKFAEVFLHAVAELSSVGLMNTKRNVSNRESR